jgi:hypothetical protein
MIEGVVLVCGVCGVVCSVWCAGLVILIPFGSISFEILKRGS